MRSTRLSTFNSPPILKSNQRQVGQKMSLQAVSHAFLVREVCGKKRGSYTQRWWADSAQSRAKGTKREPLRPVCSFLGS
jgi:hypothetical protein